MFERGARARLAAHRGGARVTAADDGASDGDDRMSSASRASTAPRRSGAGRRAVFAPHASARSKGPNRRRMQGTAPNRGKDVPVTFTVDRALDVDAGERRVIIVGECDALGAWDVSKSIKCVRVRGGGASANGTSNAEIERYVGTARVAFDASTTFKLATTNVDGDVVAWSAGNGVDLNIPRRCANIEVKCDWPVDDARILVSISLTSELSANDNKIETGGAWLAYGKNSATDGDDDENEHDDDDMRGDSNANATMDEFDAVDASVDSDVECDVESNADAEGFDGDSDDECAQYKPGDHVTDMMGGLRTELVYNAANEEDFGVRIAILEEGELVELWHEHGTEPGKGMRVGDIYVGCVTKVISGMQGVLVDLTGKGPPYALMQKGIEKPALAWREVKPDEDEDEDEDEDAADDGSASARWNRPGGWGDIWQDGDNGAMRAPTTSTSTSTSVAAVVASGERSYSRRLSGKVASGGGVWRGAGGRSQRRAKAQETRPRWEQWTPEVDLLECEPNFAVSSEDDLGESTSTDEESDDESAGEDASPSSSSATTTMATDGAFGDENNITSPDVSHAASFKASRRQAREECYALWQPGQPVVVQVTRLGSGHKGPRVTARPTLPGRNVVLCPDGEGVYVSRKLMGPARKYVKSIGSTVCPPKSALIMRTEAAGVSKETLELDISCLATDWENVCAASSDVVAQSAHSGKALRPTRLLQAATREQVLVRDLFGERISKLTVDTVEAYQVIVDDLLRTGASKEIIDRVVLHAGPDPVFKLLGVDEVVETMMNTERVFLGDDLASAHIVIQHTEALTAIDVNAGRAAMEAGEDGEDIALRVNIAAAKTVARVLRLRDIGGLVMVDLIDMASDDHRRQVEDAFEQVAARDRAQVTFVPISSLGVMEVARERLQTHALGKAAVVADEKGMPIPLPPGFDAPVPGTSVAMGQGKKVRSVKGPRPPPWERGAAGGRGRGRGRGRGGRSGRGFGRSGATFRGEWNDGDGAAPQ